MASLSMRTLSADASHKKAFLSAIQIFGASLFLALCSQISIPLHFSPVPLTGQTFGMMLVGATLGSRKGMLAVLAYILEGALGMPVFSLGRSGLLCLLGPTGGYFVGFVVQAYLVGWFMERQNHFHTSRTMGLLLLSCLIQLGLGVLWLASFVGFGSVLIMGFYPFILGEVCKSIALTSILKSQHVHEKNSHL